nr:SDR family oxidoreductase [Desulfobulbaceae bacterium]
MPDTDNSKIKILITGATGYIGRRLEERLLARQDVYVRLLVRNADKVRLEVLDRVEVVEGDTFNQKSLIKALKNIDVVYYLIHSMGSGDDFEKLDRESAKNFRDVAVASGVKKIIYLGGLGVKTSASSHLLSRIETGEILSSVPTSLQTVWFRAGVIIGAGSASFEIIRNLVQKLPIMITPRWVKTKTQSIGVEDVVSYLEKAIDVNFTHNTVVDIGTEPMSFKEMMEEAANVMDLKRALIPVPFLSPKLSSYWLILFTPIPFKMASALVEGLKSETLVLNNNARQYFPDIKPRNYRQAVRGAIEEIETDQVISRWCDSSSGKYCDIKDQGDTHLAVVRDERRISLDGAPPDKVFQSICALGGHSGWNRYDILWQIRGFLDKIVGGYGLSRGRRQQGKLRVGDALDFWKVADIKENKRLLLLAQMKLPGKAWLEFDIQGDTLVQTAHFLPNGILGRLYWLSVLPFHNMVFQGLAQSLVDNAKHDS